MTATREDLHLTSTEIDALRMAVNELLLLADTDPDRYLTSWKQADRALDKVRRANTPRKRGVVKLDLTVPQVRAILKATSEALAGDPNDYWEEPGLAKVMERGHDALATAIGNVGPVPEEQT